MPTRMLMKMIISSRIWWTLLKVTCVFLFASNACLLLWLISEDGGTKARKNTGVTAFVRPTVIHPFAHVMPSEDLTAQDKKCSHSKLSLQHDALSFAFHPMEPLNCSGPSFFHLHGGYLIPDNTTTTNRRGPKICEIFAVKRESDIYSFREKLFEIAGNITVQIAEDFVHVRCHYVNNSDMRKKAGPEDNEIIGNDQKDAINVKLIESPEMSHLITPGKTHAESTRNNIHKEPLLFHSIKYSYDSFAESINDSYSKWNNLHMINYDLLLYKVKENSLSKQHRIERSVPETSRILQPNLENIPSKSTDPNKRHVATTFSSSSISTKSSVKALHINEQKLYSDFDNSEVNNKQVQDEDYNTMNKNPDEYFDNLDLEENLDLNEMPLEVPACDEEQFLVQVSPRKYVFERHRKIKTRTGLNVLMFGIDSMSNMAFQRKLPLTLEFLEKELNAVIFKGYNIVGDGTTQALLPIFLGKLQQEIPDILDKNLDDLDFVWKHYQRQGYVTMFAEDEPHLGVFNLRLPGFQDQPTDHYMRHFWQSRADSHLKHECSAQYCTGPTPNHHYLLQYLSDFFNKYHTIPRFAVGFSGELSHDEVNPSEYLDKDLRNFLTRLKIEGHLSNSVLIVFADHGSRKGQLRRTLQGKIEERLPFLSMVFPRSFRREHKKLYMNLKKNADRLTSPFDIHETLLDLLSPSKAQISDRQEEKRGISLFQEIPENRTCSVAGIDTHWCTCVQERPIPTSDPLVHGAVQAVVSAINKLTFANRYHCVQLDLRVIHSAKIVLPNIQVMKFHRMEESGNFVASYGNTTMDMIELQVTFETDKCRGMFEVTVQVRYSQNETVSNNGFSIAYNVFERDISRINTYGSQSACICKRNPQIMKFCCCKRFLQGKKMKSC